MKVSIITVVKDNEDKIEKCIKSVINQSYKNIEYIIIDGNSSDNTKKIIQKYINRIHIFISERDNGIWDAMNKGINLATGDIIGFLNSDDFYYPDAIQTVVHYFTQKRIDFLFGTVRKYKLMYKFNPKIIKWSFGFYTSHSVGFLLSLKNIKKLEIIILNF